MSTDSKRHSIPSTDLFALLREAVKEGRGVEMHDAARAALDELEEQLEAERRDEWREGIVNVLDHTGNYLGCMGSETWEWTLSGGIKDLKEQLETAQNALREIATYGDASSRQSGEKDIARRALNPASGPPEPSPASVGGESGASSPATEPLGNTSLNEDQAREFWGPDPASEPKP